MSAATVGTVSNSRENLSIRMGMTTKPGHDIPATPHTLSAAMATRRLIGLLA